MIVAIGPHLRSMIPIDSTQHLCDTVNIEPDQFEVASVGIEKRKMMRINHPCIRVDLDTVLTAKMAVDLVAVVVTMND